MVLAEIVGIADEQAVDLVLVAGDLFDVVAPSAESEQIVFRALLDLAGIAPVVIVAGGEARGPRPGVLERCNIRVAIPLEGGVESLNVSVAVGLVLFEAVRQRRAGRKAAQG